MDKAFFYTVRFTRRGLRGLKKSYGDSAEDAIESVKNYFKEHGIEGCTDFTAEIDTDF